MHRTYYAAPAGGQQKKKAEFQSAAAESPRKPKYSVLLSVIVVLCAGDIYLVWSGSRTEGAITANSPTVSAPDQDVRIPPADVSDG